MKSILFLIFLAPFLLYGQSTNNFTITAYCKCEKCCGKWAQFGLTASGEKPKEGITAAGPRNLPFGTKIEVEGLGIRIIQDRLAKKYNNRIDIYFDSHKKALEFGKKKLNVKILK